MLLTGAEQAVVGYLAAEPGPVVWSGPPSPGGWVPTVREGGGEGADPATVQFVKSRVFPGCQLHLAAFTTSEGMPGIMLVRTWLEPGGSWAVGPIGGDGGDDPPRSRPWVNFAAQGGADLFAAGGRVIGEGAEEARLVRMTFADRAAVEDTVDNGVVLFFASPGAAFPARVEILSGAGAVLAAYQEFEMWAEDVCGSGSGLPPSS